MSKQQIGEFLYAKRGHFYFQRRVPPDVRSFYRCSRVQLALGTRDPAVARRKAARLALDLEDQWARFREQSREDVLQRFLKGGKGKQLDPRPDEIKALYLDRRGQGKPKSFEQMVERAYRYLREICGHKALSQFERSDAVKFRDKLLARGMAPQSVKRNLSVISTGVKLMLTEHGLPYENVFAGLECGNTQPVKKRVPFTEAELRHLQREARELDDEPRWLLALISDTGLRLSEAAGLAVADVVLDAEIPHVKYSRTRGGRSKPHRVRAWYRFWGPACGRLNVLSQRPKAASSSRRSATGRRRKGTPRVRGSTSGSSRALADQERSFTRFAIQCVTGSARWNARPTSSTNSAAGPRPASGKATAADIPSRFWRSGSVVQRWSRTGALPDLFGKVLGQPTSRILS